MMKDFTTLLTDRVKCTLVKHSMLLCVKTVVVGFSGGADSLCLLHILNSLKNDLNINLLAVHVNHGIRGDEANRDMNFCSDFCSLIGINFEVVNINCIKEAEKTKESIELCARRLRYDALNSFCGEGAVIATAHNANDNAETVLFNLTRGTALKGVSGIPYTRDNIIRPLLDCTRLEIESYCKENDLAFVTDSTNLQDDYTRNKLRHNVLPQLVEINTSATENINNFSQVARDAAEYMSIEAEKVLCSACVSENTYDVSLLKTLHNALLNECIVIAFSRYSSITLDRSKVLMIVDLINKGGRVQLFGSLYAECVKNKLRFFNYENNIYHSEIVVDNFNAGYLYNGFALNLTNFTENSEFVNKRDLDNIIDYDKIIGKLRIRSRKPQDTFLKRNRVGTKSLKKLFNENNIPVEIRDILPIMCDDDGIVWIYSIGVCQRCSIDENSNNIVLVKGENNG